MNVVIIEDEKNAREVLTNVLELIDDKIKILGYAENVNDAIILINNKKPDIVFLDIHIKNGNGFDVLQQIKDFKWKVIFTTAHESYAIKAIKFSAFDYLLKPILPSELKEVIIQAKKEIEKDITYNEMLAVLKHNEANNAESKIVLKTLNNQYVVLISEIIRCKSEGAYTLFLLKNKKILTSKNLKYYEGVLSEKGFIRTHQSHLINSKYIANISTDGFVKLKNDELIPISARKKTFVYKKISELSH